MRFSRTWPLLSLLLLVIGSSTTDARDNSRGLRRNLQDEEGTTDELEDRKRGGRDSGYDDDEMGRKKKVSNKKMAKMDKKSKSKKSKGKKKSKDNSGMGCPVVSQFMNQTASFDRLVILGLEPDQVTFEVAYASRITTFNVSLPYEDDMELATLQQYLASVPTLQPLMAVNASEVVLEVDFASGASCMNGGMVHVVIPRTTQTLCVGPTCFPVLCPLSQQANPLDSSSVSFAPSNNELLFGNNTNCTIVQPLFWLDWINFYFGNTSFIDPEEWYYNDFDEDALSNIVEYYGLPLASFYVDIGLSEGNTTEGNTTMTRVRHLQEMNISFPASGTDPTRPDSDGDLLTDGFELLYGLNPKVVDPIDADSDGDGLTDFEEQRTRTNPKKADSDGDGLSDSEEVSNGSNPLNDKEVRMTSATIPIALSVGDPSGSHSERYIMTVGPFEHQSPQFGVVNTATYNFRPGVYEVRVRHRDSILSTPDFDYEARITPTSTEGFVVTISDPQQLLGSFFDSSDVDRTIGKSATLTITFTNPSGMCNYNTCAECNADENCEWSPESRSCSEFTDFLGFLRDTPDSCACTKCENFAAVEIPDRGWISETAQCPCSVTVVTQTVTRPSGPFTYEWLRVDAVNNPNRVKWRQDGGCRPGSDCSYHPRAFGCIRGNGNQCCYTSGGQYIPAGTLAAGTPDRSTILPIHYLIDVRPFEQCCWECELPEACALYIGTPDGMPGARSDNRECFAGSG